MKNMIGKKVKCVSTYFPKVKDKGLCQHTDINKPVLGELCTVIDEKEYYVQLAEYKGTDNCRHWFIKNAFEEYNLPHPASNLLNT